MKFTYKIISPLIAVSLLAACTNGHFASHKATTAQTHGHSDEKQNHDKHKSINKKSWLAGDHHIHSRYSVGWDKSVTPPKAIIAGDAIYSTAMNAQMAYHHGLSWMVTTDHGGPNHSKVNLEQAYPDLLSSRKAVPNIIQFYGLELDTPGAKHSSIIMPHTHDEAQLLYQIEKNYAKDEAYPKDPKRDTEEKMLEALTAMRALEHQPIVIVNHPGRSAQGLGKYTAVTPTELRNWNDTAPEVAIGMEGSPGHQASALNTDGSLKVAGIRGGYSNHPTMGGFDQMTAKLGGFWDSMLGEGRHWWLTSSSDSHVHYSEGGDDFWPGEFAKTYVYSEKNYDEIMHNFRSGHVFVTTGDLISELYVSVKNANNTFSAAIGDTIEVVKGEKISIEVKFLDPQSQNARFENPMVNRVDIITGEVTGRLGNKNIDSNPTTQVAARYNKSTWHKEQEYSVISFTIDQVTEDSYIRVRGTNGDELEPALDIAGENPWRDLWFYSNPIFIKVK